MLYKAIFFSFTFPFFLLLNIWCFFLGRHLYPNLSRKSFFFVYSPPPPNSHLILFRFLFSALIYILFLLSLRVHLLKGKRFLLLIFRTAINSRESLTLWEFLPHFSHKYFCTVPSIHVIPWNEDGKIIT
jgi:hypothetical protein